MSGSPERSGCEAASLWAVVSIGHGPSRWEQGEISLIKDVLESRSVGAAAGGMYQLKLPLPWWLLLNYLGG